MASEEDQNELTAWWGLSCAGDRRAFSRVAEASYAGLFHYGQRFTGDEDLVKDCLQDLFLDLWEKRASLTHIRALRPYLFQAFRNNLVRRIRQQQQFSDLDFENEPEVGHTPESVWIRSESEQLQSLRIRESLKHLPKRQREALYLRYYQNLSYEEIGTVMNLQRQAVANYLQYGIQKLREYWQQVVISLLPFFSIL